MDRRKTRETLVETFHKSGVILTAMGYAALALMLVASVVGLIFGLLMLRR